ncbi:MAG: KH domain-containing protein [Oscillospiraceae bacterium]|jgi:predicted RNA-binding protein YlqC (UPF0109 family)|nr:KH domain-containing protein [Oscillospiraceae bacterium]
MKELLFAIIEDLVNKPESVHITEEKNEDEGTLRLTLNVAKDDMGRVIGKQGKIAKAIRTIVYAAAARNGFKASVDIEENAA